MINVETTGMDISNAQAVYYGRLFETILQYGFGLDPLRGNIIIPMDGNGKFGQIRIEKFVDLKK